MSNGSWNLFNGAAPMRERKTRVPTCVGHRCRLQWGRSDEGAEDGAWVTAHWPVSCFNGAAPMRERKTT